MGVSAGRPADLPSAPFPAPMAWRWTQPATSISPPATIPTCTWFPGEPSAESWAADRLRLWTALPAVQFTATATATGPPPTTCSVAQPVVSSVASAGDFGGSASIASGTWLEIKGRNLAQTTRQWTGDDFVGVNAPTTLDGVSV